MIKKPLIIHKYWIVLLLALTAFSLLSHSGADALNDLGDTCWSCQIVEVSESVSADQCTHSSDYHINFLGIEKTSSRLNRTVLAMMENIIPPLFTWFPPTPERPPIITTV